MAEPRPVSTLHGKEARAFLAIRRVIEYGRHSRTYTQNDFVRVVVRFFASDAPNRALQAERARAEKAEARAYRLAQQLAKLQPRPVLVHASPDDLPPRAVVELPRTEYEVLAEFCEGLSTQDIAKELGLAPSTVHNRLSSAAQQVTEGGPRRAAALINRGVIVLRAKPGRNAAA